MATHTGGGKAPGPEADALVIFGLTGDLARKMTFDALYDMEEQGTLNVPVIGVAIDDYDDEGLRKLARESIGSVEEKAGREVDEKVFSSLASRLTYLKGDFEDANTYEEL